MRRKTRWTHVAWAGALLAGWAAVAGADPTVTMVNPPTNGGGSYPHYAYNATLTLQADATDSSGVPITSVAFFVPGISLGNGTPMGDGTYSQTISLSIISTYAPNTAGEEILPFYAIATNESGATGQSPFGTIVIDYPPFLVTPQDLPQGTINQSYSTPVVFANSTGTVTYSASGLPPGLSIDTNSGAVSGTPTGVGTFNVTFSMTNIAGTATGVLPITILSPPPPPPVITSSTTAYGQVGQSFQYQMTATQSPTSFAASGLPTGLSIDTGSGLISGTPVVPGTTTIALSAANRGGTGSATLTLYVASGTLPSPTITSPTSASGTVGTSFSYQIQATLSPFEFGASGLPSGLSINTAIGLISGTPTAAGTSTITLSAINAGGTGVQTLTLQIALPPAPAIAITGPVVGTVSTSFAYQIQATNSPTSFGASGLPTGLVVNNVTGLISGTPSAAGTSVVTLTATNAGGTGSGPLTITINPSAPPAPAITSALTDQGTVGTAFTYQITATNSPTSFAASGLPSGLSINPMTGLISGTPTTSGTTAVALSATNAGGTGTATLTLTMSPATSANLSLGTYSASAGATLNVLVQFTPGSTSIAGLQFDLTVPPGVASVTASAGAAATAAGDSASGNTLGSIFRVLVFGFTTNTLSSGTVVQLQIQISPSASGTLPLNLSNLVASTLSGNSTPLTATTGSITVTGTSVPAAPVVTSTTTAQGTVNQSFSYQIQATNNPTAFHATNLPSGLSVNTTSGLISGTPTASGASQVTLSATNAGGTGTATLALIVSPPPSGESLSIGTYTTSPGASLSVPIQFTSGSTGIGGLQFDLAVPAGVVSVSASASPGATAAGYSVMSNNLGALFRVILIGLTANPVPSGNIVLLQVQISPSASGTLPLNFSNLQATDLSGNSAPLSSTNGSIAVIIPVPVITSPSAAQGTLNQSFSYQIQATNSPTNFNATNLPSGLLVNTTSGLISGTPTGAGTTQVALSATNAGGSGTATLALAITSTPLPVPVITSPTTAQMTINQPFSFSVQATNSPTNFVARNLPDGLSIDATSGLISGIPNTTGVSAVSLYATNASGTGTASLTLIVNPTPGSTPVASFARDPFSGNIPLTVNFTALNDGTIASWTWNFGDGATGTGQIVTHVYTTVGTFTTTLTVRNGQGITASTSIGTITTNFRPATLTAGSVSGVSGTYVTFPLMFTPSPDIMAAGISQFTVDLPPGVTFSSATTGAATAAAGDSVIPSSGPAYVSILTFGFNLNTLGAGDLADITLDIGANTQPGILPLNLSNVGFSNTAATILVPTNVVPGTLTILPASSLPTPSLVLAGTISADQPISVGYPTGYAVQFDWTVTPLSAEAPSGFAAALAAGEATSAPNGTRTLVGSQLNFASLGMPPGRYQIQVVAVDSFGQRSLPAQADVTVVSVDATLSSVRVYPNPWRADRPTNAITFDGLTNNSTVKIFTLSGRWVQTLLSANGAVEWDLKNSGRETVASGLYIYLVTDNQGEQIHGKLAIIK